MPEQFEKNWPRAEREPTPEEEKTPEERESRELGIEERESTDREEIRLIGELNDLTESLKQLGSNNSEIKAINQAFNALTSKKGIDSRAIKFHQIVGAQTQFKNLVAKLQNLARQFEDVLKLINTGKELKKEYVELINEIKQEIANVIQELSEYKELIAEISQFVASWVDDYAAKSPIMSTLSIKTMTISAGLGSIERRIKKVERRINGVVEESRRFNESRQQFEE